ncbi:hypothetical protein Ciccas_008893 [Cichlidogyrus casuarinus]|uniref:Uncharacterized protein n=1 Tax=Cichlidogyrus casuarinus TaxID=1844966 RepID=A0ABD2PZ25_9PLAT
MTKLKTELGQLPVFDIDFSSYLIRRDEQLVPQSAKLAFYLSPKRNQAGELIDFIFNTVIEVVFDNLLKLKEALVSLTSEELWPTYLDFACRGGVWADQLEAYCQADNLSEDCFWIQIATAG